MMGTLGWGEGGGHWKQHQGVIGDIVGETIGDTFGTYWGHPRMWIMLNCGMSV